MTNKTTLLDLMKRDFIFLDGAMGTMLQKSGLKLGERPESFSAEHPEVVENIHKMYIESGSNITYTNTFSANARKLSGTGYSPDDVISAAAAAAKRAVEGTDCLVGLDVGPIGELLEPNGSLKFEEAYELYKEMVIAGEKSGVDLIAFETMTDLYEVKAGVLAAKENTSLPVFVTMTFEANHRTFTGCSIEAMAAVLEGLGVDALGINCSLGPAEILPMAQELAEYTTLPIIIKANAGLPDPETGCYNIDADTFARTMTEYAKIGVRFIGGCCGTDPEYISKIKEYFSNISPSRKSVVQTSKICTPTNIVRIDGVKVIGERINPTGKKKFQQALRDNDLDFILSQGISQAEAGASILDVNVGLPDIDEPLMMERVVKSLQSVLDLPLQIDSSDPEAIEAGLRVFNGKAIVNSVNGDKDVLDRILPVAKKYGAAIVGLTLDRTGVPDSAEKRFEIAERILYAALGYGFKREDVFIDCLTLTVSAQQLQAMETLNAMRRVKQELGLHTVLGVSNISFGLPYRELINQTFLTMAMTNGLDLPIINPNLDAMMDAVYAYNVLSAHDTDSVSYIERFANAERAQAKKIPAAVSAPAPAQADAVASSEPAPIPVSTSNSNDRYLLHDVFDAVSKGHKSEVRRLTELLLQSVPELEIIDEYLIPALDLVGIKYEKGELFLPQMLSAANASQEAFALIKESILSKGDVPAAKGKIILATVKGDIHDIGKNIVKIILENYGYKIIDLGKDVDPQAIVDTAMSEQAEIVGLSALMTTTLKSMEMTISSLKEHGYHGKTIVGGAVLTPEYAKKIGADYYAADAKESADIAKLVIG